jgi:hypothetical protein
MFTLKLVVGFFLFVFLMLCWAFRGTEYNSDRLTSDKKREILDKYFAPVGIGKDMTVIRFCVNNPWDGSFVFAEVVTDTVDGIKIGTVNSDDVQNQQSISYALDRNRTFAPKWFPRALSNEKVTHRAGFYGDVFYLPEEKKAYVAYWLPNNFEEKRWIEENNR